MPASPPATALSCAACAATTVDAERGWRAYRRSGDGAPYVLVLCPGCSEYLYGEDEVEASSDPL